MPTLIFSVITQSITFFPLAFAISISYHLLRATDMTIDGSFVMGAAVFAKMITLGVPAPLATLAALGGGMLAGGLTASIQRGGRVDPLLAGVLAVFILSSTNLIIMGKPNINLLGLSTLVSFAFERGELFGWLIVSMYATTLCAAIYCLLHSRFGLFMRAMGDNPCLLKRLGKPVEFYRLCGFAITNMLAAGAGCLTAQTVGYADVGMGLGMTLTGIGAIILGQQLMSRIKQQAFFRIGTEFISCLLGVIIYYFSMNILLRLDVNPMYLKLILGAILIIFLRAAINPANVGAAS